MDDVFVCKSTLAPYRMSMLSVSLKDKVIDCILSRCLILQSLGFALLIGLPMPVGDFIVSSQFMDAAELAELLRRANPLWLFAVAGLRFNTHISASLVRPSGQCGWVRNADPLPEDTVSSCSISARLATVSEYTVKSRILM